MKTITSEAVRRGHPDKICDQISDRILDECMGKDPASRVAVEAMIKDSTVVIAGEVTTKAKPDYAALAREVLRDVGYRNPEEFEVATMVSEQSPDIALGVDRDGAGDQGIMYGYATDETEEMMPLPIVLSRRIAMGMDALAKEMPGTFGEDGKCQVSVAYGESGIPERVTAVVASMQTRAGVSRAEYEPLIKKCVEESIPRGYADGLIKVLVNPTGEFVKGGPFADCGLTGRKIICDTYGGVGRHGGGAFSGKDPTKVDRCAAYYARYAAKNVVAAGLARRCEVQVAYAIGVAEPLAVNVDTFGTGRYPDREIREAVLSLFNFSPRAIRNELMGQGISYYELAKYGHVGRADLSLPWERCNKAYVMKAYMRQRHGRRKG